MAASATLIAHRRETIDHAERSRHRPLAQGKRIDQAAQSLMSELHHWKTPEQIHAEHPLVASVAAIKRDVWMRARNGLVELDAVRIVGSRCFVHAPRYLAWRFGERA